jgi:hypothetical protein
MKKQLNDEHYAAIPGLIAQGKRKRDIAQMFGVKPATLQVLCCKRGISLRPGGPLHPRRNLSLTPDAVLSLSEETLRALRMTAREMGLDDAELASNLLEAIVRDNLFRAVLDFDDHDRPSIAQPSPNWT